MPGESRLAECEPFLPEEQRLDDDQAQAEPLDLSGRSALKYDLRAGPDAGTSASIAVQYGDSYTWCQSNFAWVPQNQHTTVVADLLTGMSCDPLALTQVHVIYIFFGSGPFDIDTVRAA